MSLFKKKKDTAVAVSVDDRLCHIAFIMDGNGRWAKAHHMPRSYGHSEGAKTFKKIVTYCGDIGIKYVTVYAFSTENWKRPADEVNGIMSLLSQYLDEAIETLEEKKTQYRIIGDKSVFTEELQEKIKIVEEKSKKFDRILNLGLNYGSRSEIVKACRELCAEGRSDITADDISSHLYTGGCPDPDLIVRTGNDFRLSNFMLWQAAYSELYFSEKLWPDFSERDVDAAVADFYHRKRRFGGL